jgi:hypothetical protein
VEPGGTVVAFSVTDGFAPRPAATVAAAMSFVRPGVSAARGSAGSGLPGLAR